MVYIYTCIDFYRLFRSVSLTGCCFVTYYTRKAALRAQDALHNIKTLDGVSTISKPLFKPLFTQLLPPLVCVFYVSLALCSALSCSFLFLTSRSPTRSLSLYRCAVSLSVYLRLCVRMCVCVCLFSVVHHVHFQLLLFNNAA